MLDPETVSDKFFSLLNDADTESRRKKGEAILSSDVRYVDPHAPEEIRGRERYLDFLAMFKGKFPELRFEQGSHMAHHAISKTEWALLKADGNVFSKGEFILDIGDGDQIQRIFGFMRE